MAAEKFQLLILMCSLVMVCDGAVPILAAFQKMPSQEDMNTDKHYIFAKHDIGVAVILEKLWAVTAISGIADMKSNVLFTKY